MDKNHDGTPVYSLGHSDRSIDTFLEILTSHEITHIIDVRSYPNSRRFPHFNEGNLRESLTNRDIGYTHRPDLGGYKDGTTDSENTALSSGFEAVADYLNTSKGQEALNKLDAFIHSGDGPTGIMCAEKDPEHCHRKIISDHLTVRGYPVTHLIDQGQSVSHELHQNARVQEDCVTYPGLV